MATLRVRRTRILALSLLSVLGCGSPDGSATGESSERLQVWAHAGQDPERQVLEAQVIRFNQGQTEVRVELTFIPEGSYNEQVQAAALAGDLPDALELDGPFVAAYAWQGHLRPLGPLLTDSVVDGLLPSLVEQGLYGDSLWAVGTFDSGLGLFARRSALEVVDASIPRRPEDAWTVEELEAVMSALAVLDDDAAVMDLHLNYPGEWYTYAFAPVLHSAGGGLMRPDLSEAAGALDGPASVRALAHVQNWIVAGRVDPNLDDAAFVEGRVALSWSGHWDFRRYRDAWGDDVAVLPLPDFGQGSRTAQGSWVWAVTRRSETPRAAAAWIEFLLSPPEVSAMAEANAAVPGLRSVADESVLYGPQGPLRLFMDQLSNGWAVPRPRTPAYPIVTSAVQEAFDAIRQREDVASALSAAARLIDQEIADNRGYPR